MVHNLLNKQSALARPETQNTQAHALQRHLIANRTANVSYTKSVSPICLRPSNLSSFLHSKAVPVPVFSPVEARYGHGKAFIECTGPQGAAVEDSGAVGHPASDLVDGSPEPSYHCSWVQALVRPRDSICQEASFELALTSKCLLLHRHDAQKELASRLAIRLRIECFGAQHVLASNDKAAAWGKRPRSLQHEARRQ